MALRGCSLLSVTAFPPAKITSSNGLLLLHQTFSPFPTSMKSKPFVNSSSFKLRAIPVPEFIYPDPIPEFAASETQKFKEQLFKKLVKDLETFGNDLDSVVEVCVKIFGEYLHVEYGGPGTLLVEPFTDMFVALNEKKLPGATLAARTSLLWAQNNLDQDWNSWNLKGLK